MAKTYIITSPENGWDCVIAVVRSTNEKLEKLCEANNWIIHETFCTTAEATIRDYGDGHEDE